MSRNSTTAVAAIKLGIFTVVSVLVTGLLAAIMGNVGFGEARAYQAIFTSATMLEKGDDVRIAGVNVGQVSDVAHYERDKALVSFEVKDEITLTSATRAEIRFLNLVGDRYLGLEQGRTDGAAPLAEDDVLGLDRTTPALDLTVLFNGFQPLFQALDPDQVNELSLNLVRVLQGEGGTISSLLAHTASLTNRLADRDKLIGDVITNLSETLGTVDRHHRELTTLINELKGWMTKLARDRKPLGDSIESVADLTGLLAGLLKESRPLLKTDIAELTKLARTLTRPEHAATLTELLERLPESLTDQTRTGTYGSWYNYYLCGFSGRITLPVVSDLPILKELQAQLNRISFRSTAARCNP